MAQGSKRGRRDLSRLQTIAQATIDREHVERHMGKFLDGLR